jgi:Spy/CpxP family protein refolding chaperone
MKNSTLAVLLSCLVVSASLALSARADEKEGPSGEHPKMERVWGEKLGLSKEQEAKLKQAHEDEAAALKPLRRELRDSLAKLHDQLEDKASDKDLQASLDRVEKARKALRDEREKAREKTATILTVQQRARIALMMGEHGMGEHGMGRWGGKGGGHGDHKGGGRGEHGGD